MPIVVIFILIFTLFVVGVGARSGYFQAKEKNPVASQKIVNSPLAKIAAMLKQIKAKNAPALRMRAMCYNSVAIPLKYQEYVCPLDGEKTIFNREVNEVYNSVSGIVEMKRLVERLNSITNLAEFNLDEKRLCHKCSPDIKDNERFIVLVTKYPDGKEYRCDKIFSGDLMMLTDFFEKKINNEGLFGEEAPFKIVTGRIRELLGEEIDKNLKEEKK